MLILFVFLQILSQYDLVLIQEIRDKAKNVSVDLAPDSFKNLVQDLNDLYVRSICFLIIILL